MISAEVFKKRYSEQARIADSTLYAARRSGRTQLESCVLSSQYILGQLSLTLEISSNWEMPS